MSLITEEIRASATEFYTGRGHEICREKSRFLLSEMGLPNGLLPLADMEDCGYVKETGFVWLRSKKKTEHKFQKISKLVHYASEVTGYVEPYKIKKLTGVKGKEMFMWVTVSEIIMDHPDKKTGNIHFRTSAGLARCFPVDAFVVEEPEKKVADGGSAAGVEGSAVKKVEEEAAASKGSAVEVKEV